MEDITKLIELGKDMGLKGSELAAFIDNREKIIREAEKEKTECRERRESKGKRRENER